MQPCEQEPFHDGVRLPLPDGDKDQKDLLGGKGANLAEMTNLDLPVPPGFTITTEACRAYMRDGHVPPELRVAGHARRP